MMQLPDSQATEPLPQDLGQGQPSEQGILGFQITENDDTRNTNSCGVDMKKLDDGWPESVEEQGLLLLVWRHHIRNNILKMCYSQSRRGVLRQNSRSARQ